MPSVYCVTLSAKEGSADAVSDNLRRTATFLKTVPGYRSGHFLRARNGAFMDAVFALKGTERPAGEDHDEGTHFILVEIWESDEARAKLSSVPGYGDLHKDLVQYLLPAHTHEFYEDLVPH